MSIRDLAFKAMKARRQTVIKRGLMPSQAYDALLWRNWRDYKRWDKQKVIEQGYERNAAFYAAANIIASTVSDIPVYVDYAVRGRRDHTTSHPILRTLDRNMAREELIELMTLYLVVTGESYLQVLFSEFEVNKRPLGMLPLPSQYVTPIEGDSHQPVLGYELNYRKKQTFTVDEVIAVRRPDLKKYFSGLSPGVPLSELIDLNNAGITWNKNVALNGGMPPVIAKAPAGQSREDVKGVVDAFEDQSGARNSHRLKVLSGNMELHNFSTDPHDAEWKEAILTSMRMILMSMGVSSSLMNDAANKTYNNVKDSRKALYLDACLPIADRLYKAISRFMSKYYEDDPIIRPDRSSIEALQEDQKAQAERLSELKLSGIISANEARTVLKWPKSHEPNADLLETAKEPSRVKPPDEPVNAQEQPTNGQE